MSVLCVSLLNTGWRRQINTLPRNHNTSLEKLFADSVKCSSSSSSLWGRHFEASAAVTHDEPRSFISIKIRHRGRSLRNHPFTTSLKRIIPATEIMRWKLIRHGKIIFKWHNYTSPESSSSSSSSTEDHVLSRNPSTPTPRTFTNLVHAHSPPFLLKSLATEPCSLPTRQIQSVVSLRRKHNAGQEERTPRISVLGENWNVTDQSVIPRRLRLWITILILWCSNPWNYL